LAAVEREALGRRAAAEVDIHHRENAHLVTGGVGGKG
jgi:hypothetical protein